MTSDQKPPQGIPPEAPPAKARAAAPTAGKAAAKPKPASKPASTKVDASKPKTAAPKPLAAEPKAQAAAPKATVAKATMPKAAAPKAKAAVSKPKTEAAKSKAAGDKSATAKASPAKTNKSADTATIAEDKDQLAKQQAAAEKAKQAKAKLAKIAAAKAKKAPVSTVEADLEPAPLAAAAITGIPALEAASATEAAPLSAVTDTTSAGPEPSLAVAKARPTKGARRASLPPAIQGLRQKLPHYIRLMRIDKPIGTLLLLWPTLWALWLAAKGTPSLKNLVIFSLGVLLMRSAGCVINDFADRKIDGRVARTNQRPLATGAVTSREALTLFVVLCLASFGLVLCTDVLTIKLSVGGLLLAASYPFMKRHTHLPQVVLGAAFAWGIPMAYAAEIGKLDKNMWVIYLAVVLWTVAYDTFYAMVDRDDDLKIGVKSTAILFGEQDRVITGTLQAMMLYAMVLVGKAAELGWVYYVSLVVAAGLFSYQQVLIRYREREACFKAFLNNNWVGAAIFVGIAGDLALK